MPSGDGLGEGGSGESGTAGGGTGEGERGRLPVGRRGGRGERATRLRKAMPLRKAMRLRKAERTPTRLRKAERTPTGGPATEQSAPPGQAAPPKQTAPPGQSAPPGQAAPPGRAAPPGQAAPPKQTAPPGASIWSRDFGFFFGARTVAKLGDTMLPVALAAGLLQHGHGAGAVGLAMAATTICFAGLVIFGGVFADRFSTRLLMIGADVARLATQSVAAILFFNGHVVLWQICVIGAVNGAAGAIFQPGVASTVPRLATDVQRANGAIRVAESAAALAGPAVAGVLVAFASPARSSPRMRGRTD